MKKKNIFLGIVGIILLITMSVGLFLWFEEPIESSDIGDNKPSQSDNINPDNTKPSTQNPSNNSANDSTNNSTNDASGADGYQENDIGYITKDNVTTFFVEITKEDSPSSLLKCTGRWTVDFFDLGINPYLKYPLCYKFSIDDGKTWLPLVNREGDMYNCYTDSDGIVWLEGDEKVLIAYTQIENCSDPASVFNELKKNVFTTKDIFNPGCGCEPYSYYNNFQLYIFHEWRQAVG